MSNPKHSRRATLAIAVSLALFTALPASAQSRTTGETAEAVDLSTVTVTARKRDERQIDVPISMTAFTGEQLDAMGMTSVVDVLQATPGAGSVDNGGGFTQVQIRGVSSSLGGNDNGYYLDEIPFTGVTVPWYPEARSWDIERVEVLKGPQGTLFGEGSMGGTVRILTRKPDFNYFNASVETTASTTKDGGDGWGAKAVVNIPLIDDRLAARVAATKESLPGWIDDATTGEKDLNEQDVTTFRAKLRFAPVDQWVTDLSYWKYDSDAPYGGNTAYDDGTNDAFTANSDEWDVTSLVSTYDFAGSQLVYAFADAELDYNTVGWLSPTSFYNSAINIGVRTQELRWSSTGSRVLDWTVGYYLREAERNDGFSLGDIPPSESSQTNDAFAVFGEATWNMTEKWALTAGLRYFEDEVYGISYSDTDQVVLDSTFDSWNPRFAVSYKPAENITLYASSGRGFRSGQLQPITSLQLAEEAGIPLSHTIDPDSIQTYELGAKALLADGRLSIEGALFHSDWEGVAVRVPITPDINGLANSEGTENKGVELNLVYMPSRNLTLQVGGAWIDAVYVEDTPGTPLNKGTPVYNVADTNFNASASWSRPVRDGLDLVLRGSAVRESARETALTAGSPGDSITMVDARIGLQSVVGWQAFLYGDNLTNEDGALNARNMLGAANRLRPRTFGVMLRFDY